MTEERGRGLAIHYAPIMDKWLVLRGRGPVGEREVLGAHDTRGEAIAECQWYEATPDERLRRVLVPKAGDR